MPWLLILMVAGAAEMRKQREYKQQRHEERSYCRWKLWQVALLILRSWSLQERASKASRNRYVGLLLSRLCNDNPLHCVDKSSCNFCQAPRGMGLLVSSTGDVGSLERNWRSSCCMLPQLEVNPIVASCMWISGQEEVLWTASIPKIGCSQLMCGTASFARFYVIAL